MMEVFLDDQSIDLFGDEVMAIDFAVNDLGDVQGRDGDAAYPLSIPLTNKNKLILQNAHVVISSTLIPYRRLSARVEVDGLVQLMGYATLDEITEVATISIFGGNADWFKIIGDKSIQQLDLSAYNHLWTATNVRDARANNTDWTDVYNYPNVDYGEWLSGDVFWYQFYTGVYWKFLVYKIFQEAGFSLEGDFWETDELLKIQYIPFCASFKRDRDYSKRNAGEWDNPNSVLDTGASVYRVYLQNTISSTHYNINNPSSGNNVLTILDRVSITFRLKINVHNADVLDGNFEFDFSYTDQNGDLQQYIFWDHLIDGLIPAGGTVSKEDTITLDIDRSEIQMYWSQTSGIQTLTLCEFEILNYEVDETTEDYLSITPTFNYVTVASILPDVKQKDLLVTTFNQYCLTQSTNHQANRVRLFPFKQVALNIPIAKNWSNKLDLSSKPIITFLSERYAQINKFQYASDDTDTYIVNDPEYCKGQLIIDNENLDSEKIVFESVFAPIKRQRDSFSGTVRLAWIPKFIGGNENTVTPRVGVILFESSELLTMDGYSLEDPQPSIHGFNLRFGLAGGLLETYYAEEAELLNHAKYVKCLLKLNATDIHTLDFSIPVYIEYFQSYFYINKIEQYKPTSVESCWVQLVKIQ